MQNNKQSTILKWSLIIGIIIVLNLFFNYAITLVYPAPDLGDIYNTRTLEQCTEIGGEWIQNPKRVNPEFVEPLEDGYCNTKDVIDAVRNPYQRNVFIVLVVLGAVSIVAGVALAVYPAVAVGLSYGGVLSLIIASMRYWSSANDVFRLLILAIALGALIWVGIKKFKD